MSFDSDKALFFTNFLICFLNSQESFRGLVLNATVKHLPQSCGPIEIFILFFSFYYTIQGESKYAFFFQPYCNYTQQYTYIHAKIKQKETINIFPYISPLQINKNKMFRSALM